MNEHSYTFTFKKDDIFIDFTTNDKSAIEKQFKIWVNAASLYTLRQKKLSPTEAKTNEIIEDAKTEAISNEDTDTSLAIPAISKSSKSEIIEDPMAKLQETLRNLKKTETMNVQPVKENIENKEITENISHEEVLVENQKESNQNEINEQSEVSAFDDLLQKSMNNPTSFEEKVEKDDNFLKILRVKNIQDKLDYFIVTAYYLTQFEKMESFTLKQINTKLMQNVSEIIDHAVLQEAFNQNLIELVPNFTGISNGTEYRLTEAGENLFLNGSNN